MPGAIPPPGVTRVIDADGDHWRLMPDGKWCMHIAGAVVGLWGRTIAELAEDYGPLDWNVTPAPPAPDLDRAATERALRSWYGVPDSSRPMGGGFRDDEHEAMHRAITAALQPGEGQPT